MGVVGAGPVFYVYRMRGGLLRHPPPICIVAHVSKSESRESPMPRKRPTEADRLASALQAVGLDAEPVENDLAVAVRNGQNATTVWIPDFPFRAYVWSEGRFEESTEGGRSVALPVLASKILETLK